jgi:hypothetical protein
MKVFWTSVILGAIIGLGWYFFTAQPSSVSLQNDFLSQTNFSIAEAPANSLRAKARTVTGLVKWENREAGGVKILRQNQEIQQGEKIITGDDGFAEINFDGVAVKIASQSSVAFIQTLPVNFVFDQASGSAFYRTLGKIPISVRSFNLISLMDKGAVEFTVNNNLGLITVRVREGKIKLGFNDVDYVSQVLELKQGQLYIFDTAKKTGKIQE